MEFGTHVKLVLGAGEKPVVGHFLHRNENGTDAIEPPGGGVENVPRQEPKGGKYVPGEEDLGKTWHAV